MQKRNLKVLINDLERAIAEIKSEVYSDTEAYIAPPSESAPDEVWDDDDGYPD